MIQNAVTAADQQIDALIHELYKVTNEGTAHHATGTQHVVDAGMHRGKRGPVPSGRVPRLHHRNTKPDESHLMNPSFAAILSDALRKESTLPLRADATFVATDCQGY